MLTKKSPRYMLEKTKSISIMMGFIMVLSLIFIAFEWSKEELGFDEIIQENAENIIEDMLPITMPEKPLPPPPPPSPKISDIINEVPDNSTVQLIKSASTETGTSEKPTDITNQTYDTSSEVVEEFVYYAEEMPEFKGNVFDYLTKNLKYPIVPQEMGVQGKVICQFVVNKDGSIVDIEVIKSVDRYLDKEAIRVIASMPKWKPGRMNGKAVRVKYTFPVRFILQ